MDRRLRERLLLNLEARVMNLSCEGRLEEGQLVDVSEAGVCVRLLAPLAAGDVVRVDFSEGTLFGQIVHVTAEGSRFRTGIEVFEVLLANSDLSRLIQRTLQAGGSRLRSCSQA